MKNRQHWKKTTLTLGILASISTQNYSIAAETDLEHISVSGSRYTLMDSSAGVNNFLSKEEIDQMPHLADDVFRMMPSIPGVTAGDYSASFNIRGGEADEVLVLLDGQQLYRPFHMKSFSGAFSIIDTENIGQMDFSSGGYSAQFGNKMSGVLDLKSLEPLDETQYSIGASFINARAGAQGGFANGKGTWLVSARRGYLDMILKAMDDETNKFEPIYADAYGKLSYQLNDEHEITLSLLYAFDDEIYDDQIVNANGFIEEKKKISGKYSSSYLWLSLHSQWNDKLTSTIIVSAGAIDEDRNGDNFEPQEVDILVDDYKKFTFIELKQDWKYRFSNDQIWQWGLDLKSLDAEYDYKSKNWLYDGFHANEPLISEIKIDTKGAEYSVYLNDKIRFSENIVAELGLRWDKQTYLGFNDDQVSPRASIAYNISPLSTLRFSWGYYHQAEDILSLQVADGVTEFGKAQKSEHRIIGFDSQLTPSLNFRAELYQKLITNARSRYESVFDRFSFFPEGESDRVHVIPQSADIKGVELSFKHRINEQLTWTGSYSYSEANDKVNGEDFPRSWDQRHAVNSSINYALHNGWNLHAAYTYHSGWPTTGEFGSAEQNPDGSYQVTRHLAKRNNEQLGDYSRIDIRASKIQKLNNSTLTWFVEVSNLLDTQNECCVDGSNYNVSDNGTVTVKQIKGHWLPLIPSLGIKWQF
ncbi:MAG: TonB-dependent receptor [Colwellia sp.]|nr:TonB-dependent receptor [Colwellia sp.]